MLTLAGLQNTPFSYCLEREDFYCPAGKNSKKGHNTAWDFSTAKAAQSVHYRKSRSSLNFRQDQQAFFCSGSTFKQKIQAKCFCVSQMYWMYCLHWPILNLKQLLLIMSFIIHTLKSSTDRCLNDTWGNTTPKRATEASMTETPRGRGPGTASPAGMRK